MGFRTMLTVFQSMATEDERRRRSELRDIFYSQGFCRSQGEKVQSWVSRGKEFFAECQEATIVYAEEELIYHPKIKSRFGKQQLEMLETVCTAITPAGDDATIAVLCLHMERLFRKLHLEEARQRMPPTAGSSFLQRFRQPGVQPLQLVRRRSGWRSSQLPLRGSMRTTQTSRPLCAAAPALAAGPASGLAAAVLAVTPAAPTRLRSCRVRCKSLRRSNRMRATSSRSSSSSSTWAMRTRWARTKSRCRRPWFRSSRSWRRTALLPTCWPRTSRPLSRWRSQ